jgi:hypothetical protein
MADISAHRGDGSDTRRRSERIDPWVFGVAAAISTAFVVWGVVDNEGVATVADDVLSWIIETFGWMFVLSTAAFLVFAAILAFSRTLADFQQRTGRSVLVSWLGGEPLQWEPLRSLS